MKSQDELAIGKWLQPFVRCFLLLICSFIFDSNSVLSDEISFSRDIRPILSDRCFHCHGPDAATRESDLRLDLQKEAFADRDPVLITPGNLEESELYKRITSEDPDLKMPPPDSKRQLSNREKELIAKWIQQGAKWEKHWSFVVPTKSRPPKDTSGWSQNEIDRFVIHKMKEKGFSPSPETNKRTLIRRVTQDLTGLPPTKKEIDEFLSDSSPQAYEKVVNRLLASPHYGERMAQVWLDAARYADSHGYSLDRRRVMWPWRDWVIRAYNQNKPFDDFVIEQLAGDLLPNSTTSQQLATGFNRNHPIQSEGGVINEEYRVETVVDRVETTSAVFLGLTMGCGRCHDHKYEPISQEEFYQFFAFFNNVPETAHVGNADNQADKPFIKAPSEFSRSQTKELQKKIDDLASKIESQKNNQNNKLVEKVWIDDSLPEGALAFGNGSGPSRFLFVTKKEKHPVLQGEKSSMRTSKGLGQHGFQNAKGPLPIADGNKLFAYVYLDPKKPAQANYAAI